MTIWEDISPHIHKIVSCVLTIPFVEPRPDRRRPPPPPPSAHVFKHAHARGYRSPFIYHSPKNKLDKKDTAKTTTAETGNGSALYSEHSTGDTDCAESNIYIASSETGGARKLGENMPSDSLERY